MFGLSDLLLGGLLPALMAAIALAVAWKLTHCAATAWIAGVLVGILTGHWALATYQIGLTAALAKSYQPAEARDWLPLALLLAVIPTALPSRGKIGLPIAWVCRAALCIALPWRLLAGSIYLPQAMIPGFKLGTQAWSAGEAVVWLGTLAAVLFFAWLLLQTNSSQPSSQPDSQHWLRSLLTVLVTVGAAATVTMSGSFSYGQLLGVIAAALVGSAVTSAILRLRYGPEAAAGPLLVAFAGTLVMAHFYSELKLLHAGLLLIAITVACGRVVPAAKISSHAQATFRCLLCVAPLAIAILLAVSDFNAKQVEAESNPYRSFKQ